MKLNSIEELSEALHLLPGIGKKSAERMAYQLLEMDDFNVNRIIDAIKDVKNKISICPTCGAYMEDGRCPFCLDETREKDKIIVVTSYKDALAFEKLNSYHGLYHILGGNISASKGIGPNDIKIDALLKRIKDKNISEVILATDPTVEGETTALYIASLLEEQKILTSRLAYGLPMGGHLTYADELTLLRSLEGRKKL